MRGLSGVVAAALLAAGASAQAQAPGDLVAQPVRGTAPAAPSMLNPAPTDTTQPRVRSVIVFGTDPCPKAASKDEIVVCARQPDEDRYRIPPQVRNSTGTHVSAFARNRNLLIGNTAGAAGGSIGSCSAVGPGGGTGCMGRDLDNWANPN